MLTGGRLGLAVLCCALTVLVMIMETTPLYLLPRTHISQLSSIFRIDDSLPITLPGTHLVVFLELLISYQ